ncbi:MAG: general secretion pathway protein GspB [Candidatus Omnitrophota bacterium]
MSIIYDALKKIQGEVSPNIKPGDPQKEKTEDKKPKARIKFNPFLILVILVLSTGSLVYFNPNLKELVKQTGLVDKIASKFENPVQSKTNASTTAKPSSFSKSITASLTKMIKSNNAVANSKFPPLVLQGVFSSETDSWAVIDDQVLKKGNKIQDAEIVEIFPHEVILLFKGESFSLSLK